MSKTDRAFRHPSADELLRLMDEARSERSLYLARLFGLKAQGLLPRSPERPVRPGALPTAAC